MFNTHLKRNISYRPNHSKSTHFPVHNFVKLTFAGTFRMMPKLKILTLLPNIWLIVGFLRCFSWFFMQSIPSSKYTSEENRHLTCLWIFKVTLLSRIQASQFIDTGYPSSRNIITNRIKSSTETKLSSELLYPQTITWST